MYLKSNLFLSLARNKWRHQGKAATNFFSFSLQTLRFEPLDPAAAAGDVAAS
jgi:hypothetical protein